MEVNKETTRVSKNSSEFLQFEHFIHSVTLFSTGRPFRGFVIQVCSATNEFGGPDGCPIWTGDFVEFPPSAQLLNCGDRSTTAGAGATVS